MTAILAIPDCEAGICATQLLLLYSIMQSVRSGFCDNNNQRIALCSIGQDLEFDAVEARTFKIQFYERCVTLHVER